MDDQELEALLSDLESDRVERKASIASKDKIGEAICAFANDLPNHGLPGVVFVGVNDDGTCARLPIDDQLLLTLGEFKSNGNILPLPSIIVQEKTLKGGKVVVVIVEPSDYPPVRFMGRTWVRVGPRRALATPEEERRLIEKRRFKDLPFDLHPFALASLDDLDLELFSRRYLPKTISLDILKQNQRKVEQQLQVTRFLSAGPQPKPTTLGILIIGKEPRLFLPGAQIQFLSFDGVEIADTLKTEREIEGPLPSMVEDLDKEFDAHLSRSLIVTSRSREIRHLDYPLVALQQLAWNALIHRTYDGTNAPVQIRWFSDRVEIHSPGGPVGQVNRANFGRPDVVDYRNLYLAEAMKNLGYVQRFGIGISLAQRALAKNGNPPVEFQVDDTHVTAIVRKRP